MHRAHCPVADRTDCNLTHPLNQALRPDADRMDCQIVMGVFVHVYLKTFVLMINVARVFEQFILLEAGEQVEVVKLIGAHMAGEGLIKPSLQTLIMQVRPPPGPCFFHTAITWMPSSVSLS